MLTTKTETAKQFLEEALEDYRQGSLQESLEKMVVLETLTREMIGLVKAEKRDREQEAKETLGLQPQERHVMWYEVRDKHLREPVKRMELPGRENIRIPPPRIPAKEPEPEAPPFEQESIDVLELSVRAENCLFRAGIFTVGQLTGKTAGELKQIRNFGQKCLEEIREKLAEKQLALREETGV